MVPRGMRGRMMKLRRVEDDGSVTERDIEAMDLTNGDITFRVDADLEPGDEISYELPGGKTRTMRLVSVDPLIAPPGMPGNLDHIGAKYTVVQQRAALRQPTPVTLPGLHPLISAASGSNIASQHYDDAVFNAFKAVEDRVKKLTGNSDIGKRLMTGVFNEHAPALDITSDNADASQKNDEREGYKFLFMGGAQGLRNPRGHGPDLQTIEQETMEMLAFASLLMRALDRAEKRKP
jgi:uncharacterized protein (TIGR02391 family)